MSLDECFSVGFLQDAFFQLSFECLKPLYYSILWMGIYFRECKQCKRLGLCLFVQCGVRTNKLYRRSFLAEVSFSVGSNISDVLRAPSLKTCAISHFVYSIRTPGTLYGAKYLSRFYPHVNFVLIYGIGELMVTSFFWQNGRNFNVTFSSL